MPIKWILHWKPNAGTTVNTQILTEISQCIEGLNGSKGGRWKSSITYYTHKIREYARDFLGISLQEQPNKHYFIIRTHRIVLEADSTIQILMEKLQTYKSRLTLNFEGSQYQLGDFQLRVGKVIPVSHPENLRGIAMEVEYFPISSMEQSKKIMEEFLDIWLDAISKKSLPGYFMPIEPNFLEYGLSDHYTSLHTAVQYSAVMVQLITSARS